jgi:hypothetical protein
MVRTSSAVAMRAQSASKLPWKRVARRPRRAASAPANSLSMGAAAMATGRSGAAQASTCACHWSSVRSRTGLWRPLTATRRVPALGALRGRGRGSSSARSPSACAKRPPERDGLVLVVGVVGDGQAGLRGGEVGAQRDGVPAAGDRRLRHRLGEAEPLLGVDGQSEAARDAAQRAEEAVVVGQVRQPGVAGPGGRAAFHEPQDPGAGILVELLPGDVGGDEVTHAARAHDERGSPGRCAACARGARRAAAAIAFPARAASGDSAPVDRLQALRRVGRHAAG